MDEDVKRFDLIGRAVAWDTTQASVAYAVDRADGYRELRLDCGGDPVVLPLPCADADMDAALTACLVATLEPQELEDLLGMEL